MNLSLCTAGRIACESPDAGVLGVLTDLLENDNPQVRTYVNGTLYSILHRPVVREAARAMGLGDFLGAIATTADPTFVRQLEYIQGMLAVEDTEADDGSDDDEEDEDEEDDVWFEGGDEDESELEDDQLGFGAAQHTGEELLCAGYLVGAEDARAEVSKVRESISAEAARKEEAAARADSVELSPGAPLQRPTTPSVKVQQDDAAAPMLPDADADAEEEEEDEEEEAYEDDAEERRGERGRGGG